MGGHTINAVDEVYIFGESSLSWYRDQGELVDSFSCEDSILPFIFGVPGENDVDPT